MIRLKTRPLALFGGMMLIAFIVLMPLRVGLGLVGAPGEGLSAREVAGPVWYGGLGEAHYGDVAIGDVNASLSPLPLLLGRARIDLWGREKTANEALRGALGFSRSTSGVDGVTATVPAGDTFAPLPVTALALDNLGVRFRDGICERASGRVTATIAGTMPQLNLPPSLSGMAKCEAGALTLPLVSQAGTESVTLRLRSDGRYTATLTARPSDPSVAPQLVAAGFRLSRAGYQLAIQGSF